MNDSKSLTFFGLAGFEFWQTGGGCTAFGRWNDNERGYILITALDDAIHPHDDDHCVMVGYYETDEEGHDIDDGTWREASSWIEAVEIANTLMNE